MVRTSSRALILSVALFLIAGTALADCVVSCAAVVPFAGNAGVPVQFQAGGSACGCTGPTPGYFWDFGDGNNSAEPSPLHTYAAAGTYTWNLTVSSDTNCTKSGQIRITASGNAPMPGTYTGTTSQGLAFSLTVNSVSQITAWSIAYNCGFGSGSTNVSTFCSINNGTFSCGTSSCSPFAVSTSISGSFTSSSTVSGDAHLRWRPSVDPTCCTLDPLPFTGTFSPAPVVATASPDTPSGTAPHMVNFTGGASGGTGPYTFAWNFGDCSAIDTAQNPSHSYGVGNWQPFLTVTDSLSATGNAITSVSALPAEPNHFQVQNPGTVAVGQPFSLTVIARDAGENLANTYDGTVHFTSDDPGATLPPDYTFLPGDNGSHTFTNAFTLSEPGTKTITATDTVDPISGQAVLTAGYATTTSVTSSPNPTAQGQQAGITATVSGSGAGALTGNVSFYDGVTPLGTVGLSAGQATLNTSSLSGGPHSITATYSGDANYLGSTSPAHTHYVLLSAPSNVAAAAVTSTRVDITWDALAGAADYEIERSTNNVSFSHLAFTGATAFTNSPISANTAYFYRVRGRDAGANFGAFSSSDRATTVIFTDDPLVLLTTTAKASHMTQLRTAVNAMRAAAALGAFNFTVTPVIGGPIDADAVLELRSALGAALPLLSLPPVSYTDPSLAAGTTIKGAHVTDLRNAVK